MPNQFAQAHFVHDDLELATLKTSTQINGSLPDQIDLVFAFAAGYSPDDFDRVMVSIQQRTGAKTVLGCSCESLIGGKFELEFQRAVSLWAASLPDASIIPMHLTYQRSTQESAIVGWPEELTDQWPSDSSLLILGEPFGFPVDVLLERFNEDRPSVKIAGGMASGSQAPGESRLLMNDKTFSQGMVAVRISGVAIRMLVSQGCRPIGDSMVITAAERNIIQSLGGKPALDCVFALFNTLPTQEQRLFQNGLQVGRVIDEYQERFGFGDFLIRNVVGIDKAARSIAIGDYVRPGQTIQFHIRDGQSASLELEQILAQAASEQPYQAALLFTCNGRGMNMFSDPHHDASRICTSDTFPLAGFFAAGEIGPVGNRNFLHGFTASLVLFD